MKELWKKVKWIVVAVVAIIVIGLSYLIGDVSATTKLDGQALDWQEVDKKLSSTKLDLSDAEKELAEKKSSLEDMSDEYDEAKEVVDQRDKAKSELKNLKSEYDDQADELDSIKSDIDKKKSELAKLESGVVAKKKQPKTLSAGHFTVGEDIEEGRYKITSAGASGNFFVNDGEKANIILGSGGDGLSEKEYVVELSDGDSIEATMPTRYQLIE